MSSPPEVVKIPQVNAPGVEATQPHTSGVAPTVAVRSSDKPIKIIHPPTFSLRTISTGLRTLFQYSDLLYTLSIFRLNVRYKQSALGWAWAAIQPLALMGIYTIVFTRVTRIATGGIPYPVFVFSGLLPWLFFSSSISNAVNGLVLYPNLLTKMYFPREIIPLSYLIASFTDFCIASTILGALMTLGIGLYAPCMILVSLLGMNVKAAFPIMMGSCAFLMPISSARFTRTGSFDLRAALGLLIGGIPAVLLAAFVVKSLPLDAMKWVVVVVVIYTAWTLLQSARREAASGRAMAAEVGD